MQHRSSRFPVYVTAFVHLIVLSGVVHLCARALYILRTWDVSALNFFSVLDLDLLWPGILSAPYSLPLSLLIAAVLYGVLLRRLR